jgi:hypothetical protein
MTAKTMEKSLIWLKEVSETGLSSLKDTVRSESNPDSFEDMIGALVDLEAK